LAKKVTGELGKNLSEEIIWCCNNHFFPDQVIGKIKPDIVVFCNINLLSMLKKHHPDTIIIGDIYGPIHIEDFLMNSRTCLEDDCHQLIENLRKLDYIITVSERQKYFWAAYMSLAGFSLSELDPLICPLSIEVPSITRKSSEKMSVVFSGGFYSWQRPYRFLTAAAEFLNMIDGAVLHIFGGPHSGLANAAEASHMLEELEKKNKSVIYHGYRPVEELTEVLSHSWCALELMDRNIERELAITGRTVEFLSLGAPVIYNNYSTLSGLIEKYDAGWTVPTDDTEQLLSVLQSIHEGGLELIRKKSDGAVKLTLNEFNSEKCNAPLIHLVKSPVQKRKTNTLSIKKEIYSHLKRIRRTILHVHSFYR
jgi:glycosyltransferase involved in cell wall biosynthesis